MPTTPTSAMESLVDCLPLVLVIESEICILPPPVDELTDSEKFDDDILLDVDDIPVDIPGSVEISREHEHEEDKENLRPSEKPGASDSPSYGDFKILKWSKRHPKMKTMSLNPESLHKNNKKTNSEDAKETHKEMLTERKYNNYKKIEKSNEIGDLETENEERYALIKSVKTNTKTGKRIRDKCVRSACNEANLRQPELITGTKLRKYVGTICQLFDLTENKSDFPAKHMGHDIRVHRNFYRLHENAVEATKIIRLLIAIEKGDANKFVGKTLNDINIEEEEGGEKKEECDLTTNNDNDEIAEDNEDEVIIKDESNPESSNDVSLSNYKRMDEIPGPSKRIRYGDADYEETLIKWYEEKSNSDIDDCQTDEFETSDHDSDSALSENEVDDNVEMSALEDDDTPDAGGEESSNKENLQNSPELARKSYYGKNRFKWSKTAFNRRSQPRQHNIIV
ncbi:hypothetical protein RN001_013264 [Aquatica leii]|uniref:Uncharacterized protein n=1 Tax=Aquatica leii TaxID=1421715 RepID=A0AAN7PQE5_9COLE|nr:hypothetical protein RN001_013264 [Aquatica leii]